MADIKIDEARAKDWVREVESELGLVEETLAEVRELAGKPVGNDSICGWIQKTVNKMDSVWSSAVKAFRKGWNDLDDAIDNLKKRADDIREGLENLSDKVR